MKKLLLLIACAALIGCTTQYKGVTNTANTVQFLRTQEDGTMAVRVAAVGRNYVDALMHAERYALKQLLFYGIPVPGDSYLSRPLITEANAQEKYESFFYDFFQDHGEFTNFTNSMDKRPASNKVSRDRESVRVVTTLRLKRAELKEYLVENNIIKR